jgi:hypothetical protein
MAKRSARALSRTRHLDQLGGGRWPFCDSSTVSVLGMLRAHGDAWCMVCPHLRLPPCVICIPTGVRANCQQR